jgi:hypothetical protein
MGLAAQGKTEGKGKTKNGTNRMHLRTNAADFNSI